MGREKDLIAEFVTMKVLALCDVAADLGDTLANTEPTDGRSTGHGPVTNSVVALLLHSLEMTRFWSAHVNLGVPMERDRAAEFTTKLPLKALFDRAQATLAEFRANLEGTPLKEAPANPPTDRVPEPFWLGTCSGTLWHIVEELSQHLGHAEVTRDILVARERLAAVTSS